MFLSKLLNLIYKIFNKINIMKHIAPSFAFWSVKCSYDETLSYLDHTTRKEGDIEYVIHIRYYLKDKKLPIMLI